MDKYSFVMRGELMADCATRLGQSKGSDFRDTENRVAASLPIDAIDKNLVLAARTMAPVYVAIAAFENSARKFIADRLAELDEDNWWESRVSEKIRKDAQKRMREEEKIRYHGPRGKDPLEYCQLGDLASIINKNEEDFRPYIPSAEWARAIINTIERSRNAIMHSGQLRLEDVQRVGMSIRDWIAQVGT